MGKWRIVLTVPGGDLPFYVELSGSPDAPEAFLVNASERTQVTEVQIAGPRLSLFLPALNSRIDAEFAGGELVGTLLLIKRGGVTQEIPLRGTYSQGYMYSVPTKTEIDVSGRWAVKFTEDDGKEYPAVGEFVQEGNKVTGTFLTPVGDYRYLEGEVVGRDFYLSCFDGGHAFLFKASVNSDGALTGEFWSGTKWHEKWTGHRDENAALPDPAELTYVKEGFEGLAFTFPRTDGSTLSYPSERFAGHVVILSIEGTWCRNCHDEAPFLAEAYRRYKERGLEIVGLMFEHYREFDRAAKQVDRYRTRHRIEHELVVAGYSDKKEAAEKLPMLNHVFAYPTMVFIDRSGEVRKIHTGFSGPGTGEHYEQFVRDFDALVEELLSEEVE